MVTQAMRNSSGMILSSARRISFAVVFVLLLAGSLSASTGRANEISNIHFENVTQTTVDVVWDTKSPSTSQVLISYSTDYEPDRQAPPQAGPKLVTHHPHTRQQPNPLNAKNGDG